MSLFPDCSYFRSWKIPFLFLKPTEDRFNKWPSFFRWYYEHLCPLLLWVTIFSFYSLPHFWFIFLLSFHPTIVLPNFLLSAFVPPLMSAITALTQASALITLLSLFSPLPFFFSPVCSCSLFSHFISSACLFLDISLLPNSFSDTSCRSLPGQDPPFSRKLIERRGK